MPYNFRIIILFFSLLLFGCSFSPNELKTAEKYLETSPDSALQVLQNIRSFESYTDGDKAFYGILLFQALDKSNKTLPADSVINFSINYYQNTNKKRELAISYYYKARLYKTAQRFDEATLLYLKAQDILQNTENYYFLGKINSDLGDICCFQKDYKESLYKYEMSYNYFNKANDTIEACYKLIDIGRSNRFLKKTRKALQNCNEAISLVKDSFIHGAAIQEIGINYYKIEKLDSAKFFLNESLGYPYRNTSYATRCYVLGEVFYELNQYDSAFYYANLAFQYPTTFFIQRDCYRVLANAEYNKKNFAKAELYMVKYQDCTDSVRQIEIQTKSTVLEDIHETKDAFMKSKNSLVILICIILLISGTSFYVFSQLRKRNKRKEKQLESVEKKLINKQTLLKENLIKKIKENKLLKSVVYKKATIAERELIDKEIYTFCLHLDNWNAFEKLMNETFNNLFVVLREKSAEINKKDLILCSLILLEVPTQEMTIILECQQASLYKLKQRLVQKLKLSGSKELEQLLHNLSSEN